MIILLAVHNLISRLFLFFCIILTVAPVRLTAAEPSEYLLANENAQANASNPTGWVQQDLITITAPGDGNTWRLTDSKVLVRAFTNPQYYNLTTKKFQNLYPGALWVTTGNELPAWYRDAANGVEAGNVSLKTAQLLGLPTSSLAHYNAVVELWVDPDKLMRATRDPNIMAQPASLSTDDFPVKPDYLSDEDYNKFKDWYTNNIAASYNDPDPNKQYPWTQLGYTYNWGGDQDSLEGIAGLSEFVTLGARAGVTSPLETFAVYSIRSYLYRTGEDGDGVGNFNITGACDTIWTGTKFQPIGDSIIIGAEGVVSGGEGILVSSSGYTVNNNGIIMGPTTQKYYGDGPAGVSVYFYDGGTLINNAAGIISGDNIAVGGNAAAASGVMVTNAGDLSGNLYAMQTGASDDSLTVENGGAIHGSVDLGTGSDHILFNNGSVYRPVINYRQGTATLLNAADVTIQNGAILAPELSGTGLVQSDAAYRIAQGTAVTGSFDTIIDHYPVFDFSLINTGTELSIRVTRIPYATVAGSIDSSLKDFAGTLDKGIADASGDLITIMTELDSQEDSKAVANALRQLSPIVHSAASRVVFATDRMRFNQLLTYNGARQDIPTSTSAARVQTAGTQSVSDAAQGYNPSDQGLWEGFVIAAGYDSTQDIINSVPGYRYDAWTFLAGIEKRFSGRSIAGFSLSSSRSDISISDTGKSRLQIKTFSPALFLSTLRDRLRLDIMSAYSYNRYNSNRRIDFDSIDRTAKSDHNGHQFSGMLNLGYRMKPAEKTTLEPMAGFYLSYLNEGGFRETGADAANLVVESGRIWAFRSHLGPKLMQEVSFADIVLDIEVTALWLHDFKPAGDITARLSSLGDSASINGITSDHNAAEMHTVLSLHPVRDLTLSLGYELTVSPNNRENSIQIGFKWTF